MNSLANPAAFRRGGTYRSLSSRWNGIPPHNYSVQLIAHSPVSPDLRGLTPPESEEACVAVDVSSRFGRRLRELRLQRSLTQSEMARKFGIDRSFISDVERGRKSISLPMIEVIALGMNITLAKLFEDL